MRRTLIGLIGGAAMLCATPAPAAAGPPLARHASAPALSAAQQRYLSLAERGVALAESRWRDRRLGWYDSRLGDRARYPLATIWDIVPLFESVDAIAIASPTSAHKRAVLRFAAGAERYLNRGLRPVPGFSPYPGDREPGTETWFDDNGWWGLAFLEAYKATGSARLLSEAETALRFIARAGWDPGSGGIWWNTERPFKSGPALASDTLLAVLIYEQTHSAFALSQAQRFLAWANASGFSAPDGLYADSSVNSTPVDYLESPLIYAQATLCRITGSQVECELARRLKARALSRFGYLLDFSPQYDAIYEQWLLALGALEGDTTLYRMAADNARNAQTRAAEPNGLYMKGWNGETLSRANALPGMIQTHAATTSLFAWLAVYPPPAG
jgi:Glycosyl hydrolase family 76